MSKKSTVISWLLATGIATAIAGGAAAGGPVTTFATMTSGEISTLHAALFFTTVWIVSSLRINRLRALWRVGFGLKWVRGPSGNLLPRGPKARAATGGSASGAGTSGAP